MFSFTTRLGERADIVSTHVMLDIMYNVLCQLSRLGARGTLVCMPFTNALLMECVRVALKAKQE